MAVKLLSHQLPPEGSHELQGAMGGSDFQLEGGGGGDWGSAVRRIGSEEFDAWGR